MYANLEENLQNIAIPIVERCGAYIVDLRVRGERQSKVVELFVDTDSGISIDLCSNISREFSALLEEQDVIQGRYRLDVSSPGLDRPLKVLRQYIRNIGKSIKVTVKTEIGITTIEGILQEVNGNVIKVAVNKGNSSEILINDIVETVVVPKMK